MTSVCGISGPQKTNRRDFSCQSPSPETSTVSGLPVLGRPPPWQALKHTDCHALAIIAWFWGLLRAEAPHWTPPFAGSCSNGPSGSGRRHVWPFSWLSCPAFLSHTLLTSHRACGQVASCLCEAVSDQHFQRLTTRLCPTAIGPSLGAIQTPVQPGAA